MADKSVTAAGMSDVSLDDKYDLGKTRVFLTGTQAIARLLLMQKLRDQRAGLDTAGFVSGYRGSPLGGLDTQLLRAGKVLKAANIQFQPGLNEDLAATAIWGSQQAEMRGEGKHDGVFALWYGKGPGVDRSGDVFRHANMAGTSRHGGVIALMGDDHTAESSTNAHQTEFVFVDRMMPVLNPAGVQEILDYGLHAIALSRFASVWVGLKCVKDNIESTSSVDGSVDRVKIVIPDFEMPPGGLGIRTPDDFLEQEKRLHIHKRAAILAYLKANRINELVMAGGKAPRIGIITVGKSYLDVRQAMDDLGIDEVRAGNLGLRLGVTGTAVPVSDVGTLATDATFPDGDHRRNWPAERIRQWADAGRALAGEFAARDGQSLAQIALRFCLSHPAVATTIPGMLRVVEVDQNAAASDFGPLADADVARIRANYAASAFADTKVETPKTPERA
jgi:indolepyruvate ferredoxin oxidoreductase